MGYKAMYRLNQVPHMGSRSRSSMIMMASSFTPREARVFDVRSMYDQVASFKHPSLGS